MSVYGGGNKTPNRQQRRAKGRPKGTDGKTLRRGEFTRIARSAGMPDDVILGALAPRASSGARKTLNRWERASWGNVAPRNDKLRQAAHTALQNLLRAEKDLRAAQLRAGVVPPPKVGENLRAQRAVAKRKSVSAARSWILAEITYLERYREHVLAHDAANLMQVGCGGSPAANKSVVNECDHRIAALHDLLAEVESDSTRFLRDEFSQDDLDKFDRFAASEINLAKRADDQKQRRRGHSDLCDAVSQRILGHPHGCKLAASLAGDLAPEFVRHRVAQIARTM
jgi:hypothetical protein